MIDEWHCQGCGSPLAKKQRANLYCSSRCFNDTRTAERIRAWLAGETSGSYRNGQLAGWARRFLVNEAGHACTECGWSRPNPVTGEVILTVDHVDGNWTNNARENLKVICYACHTLTPTFGVLNQRNPNRASAQRPATGRIPREHPAPPRPKVEYTCACGSRRTRGAERCRSCSLVARRQVDRPQVEELRQAVWAGPLGEVGARYGVSANTVKNWCDGAHVETPPRGYWVTAANLARCTEQGMIPQPSSCEEAALPN